MRQASLSYIHTSSVALIGVSRHGEVHWKCQEYIETLILLSIAYPTKLQWAGERFGRSSVWISLAQSLPFLSVPFLIDRIVQSVTSKPAPMSHTVDTAGACSTLRDWNDSTKRTASLYLQAPRNWPIRVPLLSFGPRNSH